MLKFRNILISLLFISILIGGDRIAIATKVIGSVNYARGNGSSIVLKKGHVFESGDILTTGKGGFVALLFIDDKSALKVKENSQLTIVGKRSAKLIAKEIKMEKGTIRAQVSKQKKGDFFIRTSVSVASVKGTDFWFISDKNTGDSIIGLEGVVELLNQFSGESLDITSGLSGLSSADGSIQSFKTDPKTIPEDLTRSAGDPTKLEIEFKDASGKKKILIINYK